MDKAQLRRQLRVWLQAIPADQKGRKSRHACHRLGSCRPFQEASVVMLFLSMPDEIDTTAAMGTAWQQDKTVVVPKIDWGRRTMTPVVIEMLDTPMAMARGGLRNPMTGLAVDVQQIDLVVTPGLGFDRQGHRLGRGAGFYDRFLSDPRLRAVRCGFCFSEQVVESVPVTDSDRPVDWLVTDEEVLCIKDWKGV